MQDAVVEPKISFFVEEIEFTLSNSDLISKWLIQAIDEEGKLIDYLNIIFCSDDYLLDINREYLNHDYYTDIITFDYSEKLIQGELFVSIDRVKDNAGQLDISFEEELHRVIIHGVLHLCGYGDKTEKEESIIRTKENYYLLKIKSTSN